MKHAWHRTFCASDILPGRQGETRCLRGSPAIELFVGGKRRSDNMALAQPWFKSQSCWNSALDRTDLSFKKSLVMLNSA